MSRAALIDENAENRSEILHNHVLRLHPPELQYSNVRLRESYQQRMQIRNPLRSVVPFAITCTNAHRYQVICKQSIVDRILYLCCEFMWLLSPVTDKFILCAQIQPPEGEIPGGESITVTITLRLPTYPPRRVRVGGQTEPRETGQTRHIFGGCM